MGPKRSGELFKGTDGSCSQTIKPPHHHRPQTGWKNLAHQGFVLRMYRHLLIKVANMFNTVHSAILQSESGLSEPPRKFSFLNPAGEGWFRNLVECFIHSIIYQVSRRWVIVSTSTTVIFVIQEGFTGGEFLTFAYSLDPLHHRKSSQNWRELAFCVRGISFSLGDQSPSACF